MGGYLFNYFSSDLHLGHINIIKYCKRPFDDVNEMNDYLIKKWNERVKEEDTVFYLGDFCFKTGQEGIGLSAKEYINKLNGNIIFVSGNHDKNNSLKTIINSIIITIAKKRILLIHNPIDLFKIPKYENVVDFVFCGHVHEKWKVRLKGQFKHKNKTNKIPIINVGVDMWNFHPIKFEEINKEFYKTAGRCAKQQNVEPEN